MAYRRDPDADVPDLSPEVIAILLGGWGATPPEPSIPNPGFAGGFYELASGHTSGAAADMWREHEEFLRDTARGWGWEPSIPGPGGRLLFYAEAKALGVRVDGER